MAILARAESRTTGKIFLAAFGKHPAWADHIDDLGLETDLLVSVKRALYLNGISRNIDSGAWERLDASQRLEGFDHLFFWRAGGGQVAVGRMWSSSDGKGRMRYPMVVCAQCGVLPLTWLLQNVVPCLADVERDCKTARTPQEVAAILDQARSRLRSLAEGQSPAGETPRPAQAIAAFCQCAQMGPESLGLYRVLYHVEREMSGLTEANGRASQSHLRPFHLRLPECGPSHDVTVKLWMDFLRTQFDRVPLVLLIVREGSPWVDAVIGEPAVEHLFCLRASPQALPLVTEIPYSLDQDFEQRVRAFINNARNGVDGHFFDRFPPPQTSQVVPKDRLLSRVGHLAARSLKALWNRRNVLRLLLAVQAALLAVFVFSILTVLFPLKTAAPPEPNPTIPADRAGFESGAATPRTQVGPLPGLGPEKEPDLRESLADDLAGIERALQELQGLGDNIGHGELGKTVLAVRGSVFWKLGHATAPDRAKIVAGTRAARQEPEKLALAEKVQSRLKAVREVHGEQPPWAAGDGQLADAWRKGRDELLANHTLLEGSQLSARARALASLLVGLDHSLPRGGVESARPEQEIERRMAFVIMSRREATLGRILETLRVAPDGTAALDEEVHGRRVEEFVAWHGAIAPLAGDLRRIDALLGEAYRYSESPLEGQSSVRALYERSVKSAAWSEVGPLWGAGEVQVKRLRAIEEELSADELVKEVRANKATATAAGGWGLALAAWSVLGSKEWGGGKGRWPADVGALADEAAFQGDLKERIDKSNLSDGRKKALLEQLSKAGPLRWAHCFEGLSGDGAIQGARGLAGQLGVSLPGDLTLLTGPARLNYLLFEFKVKAEAMAGAAARDEEVLAARDAFVRAVDTQWPEARRDRAVEEWLRKLEGLKKSERPGGDLGSVGPAKGGWTHEADPQGGWVKYANDRKQELEFVLVDVSPGPTPAPLKPFFLCRTEATTELVTGLFAAADKERDKFRKGLPPKFEGANRPPTAWQWYLLDERNMPKILKTPADSWLGSPPPQLVDNPAGMYSPDNQKCAGKLPAGLPMHWISATAAQQFAAILGCRLPTTGEWAAAYNAQEKDRPGFLWNLRDENWKSQHKHIADLRNQQVHVIWPDVDIFWPESKPGLGGPQAVPATSQTDGELWPMVADADILDPAAKSRPAAGRVFHHLVGNVAEFVTVAEKVSAPAPGPEAGPFAVIGGSAMSPPQSANGQPFAVNQAYPVEPNRWFSDVGFRLAFDAPQISLAKQLERALQVTSYCKPD